MTGNEIRTRFLEHFASREHKVLPSAPLVPKDDPSTLFISAGMQPLQPYYLGLSDPPAPRLASCQKCLRTGDIDEVGKTDRHNTFFEMLGNFTPTGAYFKQTAIPLAWELVTGGFDMPVDRLRVTIHPSDDQALDIWVKTGVARDRITRLGDNWWGLGRGPCGPDSEIWWDRGKEVGCGRDDCVPDHCDRFTEFWNLVFPQYDQRGDLSGPPSSAEAIQRGIADGALVPLARPAIDTGMGIERISYILQGKTNLFETDLFEPLIKLIRDHSKKPTTLSERIIADHIRAATFVIADGVLPSNEGRGYVLRRLIRRAAIHARRIGFDRPLTDVVINVGAAMHEAYPEVQQRMPQIQGAMSDEIGRFSRTLEQGIDQFERVVARNPKRIPGDDAFKLHDTFGFQLELTRELADERGIEVDEEGFKAAMAAQRERSRGAIKQMWTSVETIPRSEFTGYGELSTESKIAALRKGGKPAESAVEGDAVEVFVERTPFYAESGGQIGDTGSITTSTGRVRVEDTQKPADGVIAHLGTVITGEIRVSDSARASVDASRRGEIPLNRAMTRDEIAHVNRRVMEKVREGLPFHEEIKPYREAVAQGAMHLFEEKYGDTVRVVCFGDWTCELCGGTHVRNSADVGTALILSESSIGSGLRRIDMVVGTAADELVRRDRDLLTEMSRSFNVSPEQLPSRIEALRTQLKEAERERERLRRERIAGDGMSVKHGRVDYVAETVDASNVDELKSYADRYLEKMKSGIVTVTAGDKFVIKVSKDLTSQYDANRLKELFGKGGGPAHLVTGTLTVSADEAFQRLADALK